MKVRLEKYIISFLIMNCAIFNTLAGCCKGKNRNKNGKGYSGSGKDKGKDPTIINNEQQEQNHEDLNKKDEINEDENKNKDEENLKNPKEELIDESEKANLLKIYDNLSNNINKLIEYDSNKFSVENINVKREDIENCKKTDVETVKKKIKSNRDKFNYKITLIYGELATKYNESKIKLENDLNKKKEYDLKNLEKLKGEISKQLQNVDINDINKDADFINKIVENCKNFDRSINDLNTYLEKGVEEYKKEKIKYFKTLKDKFKLANSVIENFNYNLDKKIGELNKLNEVAKIQVLVNEIESKNNEITKFIEEIKEICIKNNNIISDIKSLLKKIIAKTDIDKYLKNNHIEDNIDNNLETYEDIKKIKDTSKAIDDFVKKEDLIKFIKNTFTNKLKQYDITNNEKKDINILNCLLICNLFEKNINDSKLFKKISEGDNIKNEILNYRDKQMSYYKAQMDENKVYIGYGYYDDCGKYIFAKIDEKDFIIEPYELDYNNISEAKDDDDDDDEYLNRSRSVCIKFKYKDKKIDTGTFNKIFKKNEKYKDIILLTEGNYICYRIPDDFIFHIVFVNNNSFDKLFSYCSYKEITILYNSPNVTDMSSMFKECKNLENLDLSNLDTSKVTNMGSMFYDCTNLKNITFGDNFNTSNTTNMSYMFSDCTNLTNLDFSNFNTSNTTNMESMFSDCTNLENLDLNKFDTSKVTDMSRMFKECKNLKNITFGDNFYTSNTTNMESMFYNCTNLENLDLSNFNTSNVTTMSSMFCGCTKLKELDLSKFNTSKVTNMEMMFKECKNLKNITFVNNFNTSNITTMRSMFENCTNLENLDLSNFDTSKVESMSSMFEKCTNLKNLDLSNFDTSKVESMLSMFEKCTNLKNITFGNKFNTSNVTTMRSMFYNCTNLENLDLSNFDTSKVTNMSYMFSGCKILKNITLGDKFKFDSLKNCSYLFENCKNINKNSKNKINEILKPYKIAKTNMFK